MAASTVGTPTPFKTSKDYAQLTEVSTETTAEIWKKIDPKNNNTQTGKVVGYFDMSTPPTDGSKFTKSLNWEDAGLDSKSTKAIKVKVALKTCQQTVTLTYDEKDQKYTIPSADEAGMNGKSEIELEFKWDADAGMYKIKLGSNPDSKQNQSTRDNTFDQQLLARNTKFLSAFKTLNTIEENIALHQNEKHMGGYAEAYGEVKTDEGKAGESDRSKPNTDSPQPSTGTTNPPRTTQTTDRKVAAQASTHQETLWKLVYNHAALLKDIDGKTGYRMLALYDAACQEIDADTSDISAKWLSRKSKFIGSCISAFETLGPLMKQSEDGDLEFPNAAYADLCKELFRIMENATTFLSNRITNPDQYPAEKFDSLITQLETLNERLAELHQGETRTIRTHHSPPAPDTIVSIADLRPKSDTLNNNPKDGDIALYKQTLDECYTRTHQHISDYDLAPSFSNDAKFVNDLGNLRTAATNDITLYSDQLLSDQIIELLNSMNTYLDTNGIPKDQKARLLEDTISAALGYLTGVQESLKDADLGNLTDAQKQLLDDAYNGLATLNNNFQHYENSLSHANQHEEGGMRVTLLAGEQVEGSGRAASFLGGGGDDAAASTTTLPTTNPATNGQNQKSDSPSRSPDLPPSPSASMLTQAGGGAATKPTRVSPAAQPDRDGKKPKAAPAVSTTKNTSAPTLQKTLREPINKALYKERLKKLEETNIKLYNAITDLTKTAKEHTPPSTEKQHVWKDLKTKFFVALIDAIGLIPPLFVLRQANNRQAFFTQLKEIVANAKTAITVNNNEDFTVAIAQLISLSSQKTPTTS